VIAADDCVPGPEKGPLVELPDGIAERSSLLLVKVAHELTVRGVARLQPLGIDGRDYSLLAVLSHDDAGSQAQLAALCSLLPAQLVPVLDALEHQGLVERRRDARDRRRSIVTITDAGRERLAQADEAAHELEVELLGDLDEELRERLVTAVRAALPGSRV
jgi:DNA-binding MarR family transcriptional regulator